MAKRKAGVNDIIYELDNDDSELSSEDEVKQPKIIRIEVNNSPNTTQSDSNTQSSGLEVIDIDSSTEKIDETHATKTKRNGGKSPVEFIIIDEISDTASPKATASEIKRAKKFNSDSIYNEDIIIDSPASNSDLGVVGCENRTPLITVKFKDNKLAMSYKRQIKAFMLNLIKLHGSNPESDDDETDLELDIWPEDLDDFNEEPEKPADDLFFVDTDATGGMPVEVPWYSQNTLLISNAPENEQAPPSMPRWKGPTCFNCTGSHTMRECTEPWNNARIAENRKAFVKKGRYHVEDEQKYGHLVPGRISGQLRHALNLKRHELPMHIYRMRQLGYPPGWLEEARISHSGISLFDSSGQATMDPDDEEGEVCEPGSKDKFDIKKILDFPGFNVPASSRYKEEAHALGLPPISEADSKLAMLTVLAPNAMQAYKRKKLALFPGLPVDRALAGTAEMDIDSGDEIAEFPSQPPLPDDAPPPPPPPPDAPPPRDSPPPLPTAPPPPDSLPPLPPFEEHTKETKPANPKENSQSDSKRPEAKTDSDDDLEVVEVMKVGDIPVPLSDMITIDVDGDVSEPESGCVSPSLDDLEQKKRLLLDALGTEEPTGSEADSVEHKDNKKKDDTVNTEPAVTATDAETKDVNHAGEVPSDMEIVDEKVDSSSDKSVNEKVEDRSTDKTVINVVGSSDKTVNNGVGSSDKTVNNGVGSSDKTVDNDGVGLSDKPVVIDSVGSNEKPVNNDGGSSDKAIDDKVDIANDKLAPRTSSLESTPKGGEENDLPKTPITTVGLVTGTEYGTPVINVASPYMKLPSDDKFAKDICDVINFENLPNSVGKYKKISTLLKKVKSEVDRIQES